MVTSYKCDICSTLNDFDSNYVLAHAQEKFADLCVNCKDKVMGYIQTEHDEYNTMNLELDEQRKTELVPINLQQAQNLVKQEGFIFYKKPAVWGQKANTNTKVTRKKEKEKK